MSEFFEAKEDDWFDGFTIQKTPSKGRRQLANGSQIALPYKSAKRIRVRTKRIPTAQRLVKRGD